MSAKQRTSGSPDSFHKRPSLIGALAIFSLSFLIMMNYFTMHGWQKIESQLKLDHRTVRSLTRLSSRDVSVLKKASFIVPATANSTSRRAVIVTACTYSGAQYLANLLCSLKRVIGNELVVFTLDKEMEAFADTMKIPHIIAHDNTMSNPSPESSSDMHKHSSPGFRRVAKKKLYAVRDTLSAGFDVLFMDVDIVLCKDFRHVLAQELSYGNSAADIFMQNNGFGNGKGSEMNTGFYYAQSNGRVRSLFKRICIYAENDTRSDQPIFNEFACQIGKGYGRDYKTFINGEERSACWWDESVIIRALSLPDFGHGGIGVGGKVGEVCMAQKIVMWHNNYCTSSEKKKRFIDNKLWFINEKTMKCA